jgi:AraC family transcriptional regulator
MQLVFNPRASIFDIAHDASFTNAESFSRDPATTPFEDYRLDICVSVTQPVAPNPQGVVTKSIPAGRCARVRHVGSRHNVHPADWIYREWLPQSGEQLRNFPIFFHYVNVGPDVKEHELITDVYLPLI